MARKGRAVNGWLVVDKPAGVGSTTVVAIVRRALGAAKAGHAGTLDPDATGVLAVALGEATKTVPVLAEADKTYLFRVAWGAETATDDAGGAVLRTDPRRPARDAVEAALAGFRGDIMQVPPQVSAVRVDGARAYDLAREGVAMDLAARPLHVAALDVVGWPDDGHADLRMTCGKGGYVRSVARDLGRSLGCLAHVAWLRREASGPFVAADALPLAEVERLSGQPELDAHLRPLQAALAGMVEVVATAAGAARLRQGNAGEAVPPHPLDWGTPVWASHDGTALALGRWQGGMVQPSRVFV